MARVKPPTRCVSLAESHGRLERQISCNSLSMKVSQPAGRQSQSSSRLKLAVFEALDKFDSFWRTSLQQPAVSAMQDQLPTAKTWRASDASEMAVALSYSQNSSAGI